MRIVAIHDDGREVDVTEAVQITYDLTRQSLDWGSGLLDTQEMIEVVKLAEACGFPDFEEALAEAWRVKLRGRGTSRGYDSPLDPEDRAAALQMLHP